VAPGAAAKLVYASRFSLAAEFTRRVPAVADGKMPALRARADGTRAGKPPVAPGTAAKLVYASRFNHLTSSGVRSTSRAADEVRVSSMARGPISAKVGNG